MKKTHFKVLSPIFFILGIVFLLNSKIDITGAVIGVSISLGFSFIFGAVLIFVSVILFVSGENLDERVRIRPKKELTHLTPKQRTFRRKLINLHDLQRPIDPKKIAYLLPQYDKVQNTGEYIGSHNYKVYKGRKESREEYFTIDSREVAEVKLGEDIVLLPIHIDLQRRVGRNRYVKTRKENIDWNKMIKESESEDIITYFKKRAKKN